MPLNPSKRAASIDTTIVRPTDSTTSANRLPAEQRDLADRDAQPEKRHPKAQHTAGSELDARPARPFAPEEVHRDAEEQREQHHRRAVVLREEGSRGGDDAGRRQPWEQRVHGQGTSTVAPTVLRDSRARCAAAASASG